MKIGFWEIIIIIFLYFLFSKYSQISKKSLSKKNKHDQPKNNFESIDEPPVDVTDSATKGRE
jgi:hypothetical protein